MTFRAAVLHEVGQPLVVEDVTLGTLRPRDVLVHLHASGLKGDGVRTVVLLNGEVRG